MVLSFEPSIPSLLPSSLSVTPGESVIMNLDTLCSKPGSASVPSLRSPLSNKRASQLCISQHTSFLGKFTKKMTSKGSYHLAPKFLRLLFQSGSSVGRTHTRNFKQRELVIKYVRRLTSNKKVLKYP